MSSAETVAWSIPGGLLGEALVDDDTLFAYRRGEIHAHRLSDGSTIWRRPAQSGDQAMIGLRFRPNSNDITVDVIPGSSAEAAGLENGDRVTAFDGEPINSTDELIQKIKAKSVGDAFTVSALRGNERDAVESIFTGNLGVYLMTPIAANHSWVVLQRMNLHPRGEKSIVLPDTQNGELRLVSRATGEQVWSPKIAVDHAHHGGAQTAVKRQPSDHRPR